MANAEASNASSTPHSGKKSIFAMDESDKDDKSEAVLESDHQSSLEGQYEALEALSNVSNAKGVDSFANPFSPRASDRSSKRSSTLDFFLNAPVDEVHAALKDSDSEASGRGAPVDEASERDQAQHVTVTHPPDERRVAVAALREDVEQEKRNAEQLMVQMEALKASARDVETQATKQLLARYQVAALKHQASAKNANSAAPQKLGALAALQKIAGEADSVVSKPAPVAVLEKDCPPDDEISATKQLLLRYQMAFFKVADAKADVDTGADKAPTVYTNGTVSGADSSASTNVGPSAPSGGKSTDSSRTKAVGGETGEAASTAVAVQSDGPWFWSFMRCAFGDFCCASKSRSGMPAPRNQ